MKPGTVHNLADYRKQKGLTQEELAEQSGITSRTIQRIESGQVVPQMHTLKVLANCLDTQPENLVGMPGSPFVSNDKEAKQPTGFLAVMHISPLVGIYLPFTNILIPVVFWLLKKDEQDIFDQQGRKIINFQLTITIIGSLSMIVMVLFFPVGYPLLMGCYIFAVVMAVYNVVSILKQRSVYYPLSIRLLKIKH
ncbi:helix-turn-helix domain-containing protein [Mucilaginibacter sp. SG564]|uniref:helix-turn-helix domain-containing protein n=1 Tax=unclassified Mucilaginibacter TaxID=2617802 RepID=UPI00155552BA|nr:helix-turn-helix domain-containing protein [Mucilaginibacter sp. SG564]NOW96889.1 putative Tic20 family protein/DNA-binding Xre family transcriptional regulator [Mucilaginibacter sp. SG564]